MYLFNIEYLGTKLEMCRWISSHKQNVNGEILKFLRLVFVIANILLFKSCITVLSNWLKCKFGLVRLMNIKQVMGIRLLSVGVKILESAIAPVILRICFFFFFFLTKCVKQLHVCFKKPSYILFMLACCCVMPLPCIFQADF